MKAAALFTLVVLSGASSLCALDHLLPDPGVFAEFNDLSEDALAVRKKFAAGYDKNVILRVYFGAGMLFGDAMAGIRKTDAGHEVFVISTGLVNSPKRYEGEAPINEALVARIARVWERALLATRHPKEPAEVIPDAAYLDFSMWIELRGITSGHTPCRITQGSGLEAMVELANMLPSYVDKRIDAAALTKIVERAEK